MSLVLVGLAYSQGSLTSLQGSVTDPTGSAVANAKVVLANADSKIKRAVNTGSQGGYHFPAIPPGIYTITISATGFATYKQTDRVFNVPIFEYFSRNPEAAAVFDSIMQKRKHYCENNELVECCLSSDTAWDSWRSFT